MLSLELDEISFSFLFEYFFYFLANSFSEFEFSLSFRRSFFCFSCVGMPLLPLLSHVFFVLLISREIKYLKFEKKNAVEKKSQKNYFVFEIGKCCENLS